MEPINDARAAAALDEDNPYLTGRFAPIQDEIVAEDLTVLGELPEDIEGMFLRNGSNPRFAPKGKYHWFDGDAMLHAMTIRGGKATYRNRYIRTKGFLEDEAAGESTYSGIMESPDMSRPGGPFKNTANTDLVYHDGKLLALWWLGGNAHHVRLPNLETMGEIDFCGKLARGITAHPKVDARTGEMMFFDYDLAPPFMNYGVVDAKGVLVHQTPIEIPGARLQHDIAITENYTLLFDMPMYWDPELLMRGKTKVVYNKEMPGRIGVIPRYGSGDAIRWFETDAFYMYHTINAYEENGEVVLVGCRIDDPIPKDRENLERKARLSFLQMEPYLTRWRLNLESGLVKRETLDDVATEFPRTNDTSLGSYQRYTYNPRIAHEPQLLFDGLVKYDLERGTSENHAYGAGRWGGEASFAPRANAVDEDDGYLLTFLYDEAAENSELLVIDAKDMAAGPIARIQIPQRVPIGYHTRWVSQSEIDKQHVDA